MVMIPKRDEDNEILVFGKYKGKTPMEILEDDPHYLVWCFENVETQVICSRELYEEAQEKAEDMDAMHDIPNFARGW